MARGYAIGDIFAGGGHSNDSHLRSNEFVRLAGGETNDVFLRLLSTWNIIDGNAWKINVQRRRGCYYMAEDGPANPIDRCYFLAIANSALCNIVGSSVG